MQDSSLRIFVAYRVTGRQKQQSAKHCPLYMLHKLYTSGLVYQGLNQDYNPFVNGVFHKICECYDRIMRSNIRGEFYIRRCNLTMSKVPFYVRTSDMCRANCFQLTCSLWKPGEEYYSASFVEIAYAFAPQICMCVYCIVPEKFENG